MITLASVVEGHGEVQALPVLIRRLADRFRPGVSVDAPTPFRLPRGKFRVVGELERAVAVASRKVTAGGGVLVLVDADDDCPVQFAAELRGRCEPAAAGCPVAFVAANREFEAWFLAALPSLSSHPDVLPLARHADDGESVRDAKGRLQRHMMAGVKYSETRHQPAFSALMDLDQAAGCRSFRKLMADVERLLVVQYPAG